MQRIFNVDKWTSIEVGQVLEFPVERPRLVRLEVNAPDVALLYLLDASGTAMFLARVCGRDTVEFISPGAFSLSVTDGACSVYTVDGTVGHRTVEAPQSFTTIVERRKRNPELDAMMRMMNQNIERRLAQQADELAEQYGRRQRQFDERTREMQSLKPAAASVSSGAVEASAENPEPPAGGGSRKGKGPAV